MAMQQSEKFVFLQTFFEHRYLASFPTKPLEIFCVCTSLSHRGNRVSDSLYVPWFLFY